MYSEAYLKQQARKALAFPNAYGLTVRFAMKACPNAAVLQTFMRLGLHIDASSGFEVRRAIAAGFAPDQISLSGQEVPADLGELLALGEGEELPTERLTDRLDHDPKIQASARSGEVQVVELRCLADEADHRLTRLPETRHARPHQRPSVHELRVEPSGDLGQLRPGSHE